MINKLALAAACLMASTVGGVALGGYTIGGFHLGSAPDPIGDAAQSDIDEASGWTAPAGEPTMLAERAHVCRGCDAHPYRDVGRGVYDTAYLRNDAPAEPEEDASVKFVDA